MEPFILRNLAAWAWQAAVLVGLALLLVRPLPPAVRYAALRIVLAACLVLPVVQMATGLGVARELPAVSTDIAPPLLPGDGMLEGPPVGSWLAIPGVSWFALPGVLAAGVLARLCWIGVGVARLRRFRRAGAPAREDPAHGDLQSLIGTHAEMRYVAALSQPATFGFRHAVVLLPESIRQHPEDIRRAVLAHELWHVRRRDWLWTAVEEVVRACFWFHPGIWLLVSSIQRTREEVVDELTILTIGSRRRYAEALLAFADTVAPLAASALARRRHLVHRLALVSKEVVMSARRVVVSCCLLCVALSVSAWYAVQAFPLVQAEVERQSAQGPGPVERRAKPITPENPIPRRIYSVPVDYPSDVEAAGASGSMAVRLALDESGHVAEARVVGLTMRFSDGGTVSISDPAGVNPDVTRNPLARVTPEVADRLVRPIIRSAMDAALRAVRQWQYAPPAEGPVAFTVNVPVGSSAAAASSVPPPPPPPPPASAGSATWLQSTGALRVGGNIKPPAKIHHVNPLYPPDALSARLQGVVIIETRIEPDGSVGDARILRSIPLLDGAALEAVRQWRFMPTLLNGEAVPVIMTVTVNFRLD